MEHENCLGKRVVIKQSSDENILLLATVKWRGELPGKKSEWIGIVYDEPHGKHDGTFNGIKYFESPNQYASFIRENKILSNITLYNAIKLQYTRDIKMEKLNSDSEVFFNQSPIEQLTTISVRVVNLNFDQQF